MLYNIGLISATHQHELATGVYMSPLLDPCSLCFPPLQVVTEPQFEFPETYSKFPLAIYFIYGNVSFHVTYSFHTSHPLLPCPQVCNSILCTNSPNFDQQNKLFMCIKCTEMKINEIQLHDTTWIDFTSTIVSKRTHKIYIIHDCQLRTKAG